MKNDAIKIDFTRRADRVSSPNNLYLNSLPAMAWVNMNDGKVPYVCGRWHTCRETLTGEICRYFHHGHVKSAGGKVLDDIKYQTSKLHIAFGYRVETRKDTPIRRMSNSALHVDMVYDMFLNGLHVVNIFERHMNIPMSRLRKVSNHDSTVDLEASNIGICLLSGSRKWLRSTHILSLFLMLMRVGIVLRHNDIDVTQLATVDDVKDSVRNLYSKLFQMKKGPEYSKWFSTVTHMKTILDNSDVIINNHEYIFKSDGTNRLSGDGIGYYGIQHFITNVETKKPENGTSVTMYGRYKKKLSLSRAAQTQ